MRRLVVLSVFRAVLESTVLAVKLCLLLLQYMHLFFLSLFLNAVMQSACVQKLCVPRFIDMHDVLRPLLFRVLACVHIQLP